MTYIAPLWAINVQMLAIPGGTCSPLDTLHAIGVEVLGLVIASDLIAAYAIFHWPAV
jgi:hypothetical protein